MGASESKLVFKQGVFKLSERSDIPLHDPYWAGFWRLPESIDDVFSLFSSTDIRRIRDEALENLEKLIYAITSHLFELRNHKQFPNADIAPASHALNCIRVLTRILPYIYEAENLERWEDEMFWDRERYLSKISNIENTQVLFEREQVEQDTGKRGGQKTLKSLGEKLIDTLIELLFFEDFTIPKSTSTTQDKVNFIIWQSGVGCNSAPISNKEMEGNRTEIIRLLLTICSKSVYTPATVLPVQGIKAITYITTTTNRQIVLTLLCSLLNTTLRYNHTTWRMPYDHVMLKDPKQILVTYCLHFLLVLILYPVPEASSGAPPKNYFRHFLGKLHQPQDFHFLAEGMTRTLKQPLQATTAILPGSQRSLSWAPEMVMLFWEALQCNKRFRSYLVETDQVHDFVILVLFQVMEHKNNPARQGIVRMCVFVLQTLSVEPNFGVRMNKQLLGQESLPPTLSIPGFHGSYTDFLIISTHNLMSTCHGKTDAIFPALLAMLNNIAPHIMGLTPTSSSKIIQLFIMMSSPSFLLANESNYELLSSLLEAINAILEHQYTENPNLIYVLLKAQRRIATLQNFAIHGAQNELDRRARHRKEASADANQSSNAEHEYSPVFNSSPTYTGPFPLENVPEEGSAFTIGDDEDSDQDLQPPSPVSRSVAALYNSEDTVSPVLPVDEVIPAQVRGLSVKARGKLPAGKPPFSRQNSSGSSNLLGSSVVSGNGRFEPTMAWVESWTRDLPLQTIETVFQHFEPRLPQQLSSSPASEIIKMIRDAQPPRLRQSPVRVHLFEWTPLSLGWYESVLWGFIFSREMAESKGSTGIWKGTAVRLFRVQDSAIQGPSLLAPRGAVDAVGSNLVQTIGRLNLRGAAPSLSRSTSQPGSVRDV